MTTVLILASFLAGIAVERALAKHRVTKRQTDLREFRMLVCRPLDLEPCEFTGFWQERAR